jgi:hypothetical protein
MPLKLAEPPGSEGSSRMTRCCREVTILFHCRNKDVLCLYGRGGVQPSGVESDRGSTSKRA